MSGCDLLRAGMAKVRFAFGKNGLMVTLPDEYTYEVIESRTSSPVSNPVDTINDALEHPVTGRSLQELAKGKKSAAIAVCDITRPVPNRVILPLVLEKLHKTGIDVDGISIIIATGLHRNATPEEILAIVGPEVAAKYKVLNHDARRAEQQRFLGNTKKGTPVYIDERYMGADLHLSLGFIEPHLMAGFSGGRKLIAPGLAGEPTIKTIHSPKFMREPKATEGSIHGNPLHNELLEIAGMAGHDFILDVTLTPDRQISGVFAGEPVAAHAAGMEFLLRTSLERLTGLADVVITSAAGYPLDLTFYQTIKGVTAAQHVVKPGGRILTIGECSEGVGSPEFSEKLRTLTGFKIYLDEIKQGDVVVDQWQLEKLALIGLNHELFFYAPGVRDEQLGVLARNSFSDLDEAVRAALRGLPANSRVALVPEGPYVFARLMEGQTIAS
jgi:nickel-dependent lactate racemase